MTNEARDIRRDRMRYTKNTQSSGLAILAIVFDVLYFVSVYQSNVGNYYYTILIGVSIIYNLIFMLAAFLSSEGVKNYKQNYSWLLLVLGAVQLARIFILPMRAHGTMVSIGDTEVVAMGDRQFVLLVLWLVLSAVCLIASAVINYAKCKALAEHMKTLAEKSA